MFNILSFLEKDKASNDPLANRKSTLRWLEELSGKDTAVSHAQILNALISLRTKNSGYDKESLDVLIALDEYARPLQAILCEQYLRNTRMSTAMETKLWQSIYTFYSEISMAYFSYITVNTAEKISEKFAPLLPKITLRALNDLGNIFKWRYFHYNQPDEKLWRMLHKLYRIAVKHGFITQPTPLYDNAESRCSDLYIRALLLTQIHPSALHAKQIEMADTWLLRWVRLINLEKSPKLGQHHFYVDLAKPAGATVVTKQSYPDSCLCWDASTLLCELRRTRDDLQSNPTTSLLGMGVRLAEYLKMLDYVETQWDPANLGKLRKSPRIATRKVLSVVHGFNIICSALKDNAKEIVQIIENDDNIKYAEMVDIQLYGFITEATRSRKNQFIPKSELEDMPSENWGMEDESEEGYRAYIPTHKNDWLRLSRLVGVKAENESTWKIAVVRRLFRAPNTGTHVGMEILGKLPVMMMFHPLNPNLTVAESAHVISTDLPVPVIITHPVQNGMFTLIIDSANYTGNRLFKVTMDQEPNIAKLGHVIEQGDSWIHVQATLTNFAPTPH